MSIVVQKYGGASLADVQKIKLAMRNVVNAIQSGYTPVVVVSAQGNTTDELIDFMNKLEIPFSKREFDSVISCGEQISAAVVSSVLKSFGIKAVSMNSFQAKIVGSGAHGDGTIDYIDTDVIRKLIASDIVPVITGFQAVNSEDEILTLGRGGSDLTAVALAAALNGKCCLYKESGGVFDKDPLKNSDAEKYETISYDEMITLAQKGARVLSLSSIKYAQEHELPIYVMPVSGDEKGTVVGKYN